MHHDPIPLAPNPRLLAPLRSMDTGPMRDIAAGVRLIGSSRHDRRTPPTAKYAQRGHVNAPLHIRQPFQQQTFGTMRRLGLDLELTDSIPPRPGWFHRPSRVFSFA